MKLPARKRIRLSPDVYVDGGRIFSVTCAVRDRAPVFADLEFGHACILLLRAMRDRSGARVFAYCCMPDHAHLVLSPPSAHSLTAFVGEWKARCYQARRRRSAMEPFWQRSFFDHALRTDAELHAVVAYVLANPVRAGLVEDVRDYPLSGSFELTFDGAG